MQTPPPHILLIEDSVADVGLVREALNEHRVACEITVVNNGDRAIKFFDELEAGESPCPSLIIPDLNLPKKSGKVVLANLRERPKIGRVPVIILTSSDSQRDKDDVARFSPSRYIRKPSNLDDFMSLGAVFKQIISPVN